MMKLPINLNITPKCSCNYSNFSRIKPIINNNRRNSSTNSIQKLSKIKTTTNNKNNNLKESILSLSQLIEKYPILTKLNKKLNLTLKELNSIDNNNNNKFKIVVIGNKKSGITELITASFENPKDEETNLILGIRRFQQQQQEEEIPELISISYGETIKTTKNELNLPSIWLRDNNVKILEIVHSEAPPLESSIENIYIADVLVMVISEEDNLLPVNVQNLLKKFHDKPNFILALNSREGFNNNNSTQVIERQLESMFPSSTSTTTSLPSVIRISTSLALEGLEALNPLLLQGTNEHQLRQYELFQSKYNSSNVGVLRDQLASIISNNTDLEERTARYTFQKCLNSLIFESVKDQDDLLNSSNDVKALQQQSRTASNNLLKEIGITSEGILKIPSSEIESSRKLIQKFFKEKLNWFQLLFKSDDIISDLTPLLEKNYLDEFESNLIFNTGKFLTLAKLMSLQTDSLLSTSSFTASSATISPFSSLYSPILLNHLESAHLESLSIPSTSLSSHITKRRSQLLSPGGPLEILQLKSQEILLNAITLSTSSLITGVTLDYLEYAELGTSLGIAGLGIVLAVRRLQNGWEKAKRRFGKDLEERVIGGLEEDLGEAVKRLLDRSLYKSNSAIFGIENLIKRKQFDLDEFNKGLMEIVNSQGEKKN